MNNTSITTFLGHNFLALRRAGAAAAALLLLLGVGARAQSAGSLNTSFNPGTGANSRVLGIVRQGDGKLVLGGQFTTFNGVARGRVARLNYDGSIDTSFDPGSGPDSTVNAVAVGADGKVVAGGDFFSVTGVARTRLARFYADGTLDLTFAPVVDGTIQAVAVDSAGRVYLAGSFTLVNGVSRPRVARLNIDGTLDLAFAPGTGPSSSVLGLELQADGKVLISGYFSSVNGVTRHRVARLNIDGTVDTTFVPGTLDNGYANFTSTGSDGKIMVGGGLYVGLNSRLLRLNPNGSVDTTFNVGNNVINSDVTAAVSHANGTVIIAGYFTAVNGVSRNSVARLLANGTLDTSFNPGVGANNRVTEIVLEPDGSFVAGGDFTTYQGVSRNRITRIHSLFINQAPIFTVTNSTILEDSVLASVTVTGIAAGPVGDGLTVVPQAVTNLTATSSNPALVPDPLVTYTPGATTATLAFTPLANATGTVTITVVAQDNAGTANLGSDRSTNTFTLTVAPVNDAPSFTLATSALSAVGAVGEQSVPVFAANILAGPANESGQAVSFLVTNNNNALFSTQPAIGVDGTLTFTPALMANGVATVTVNAQDNGGTANGGVDTSAAQTFTITVVSGNVPPSASYATNNLVVLEDTAAQTVGAFATFSVGPVNESTQTVSVVSVTAANPALFSSQPALAANGTLTFTPAANANGATLVTVVVADDGGTVSGGVDRATNTFTITVTPVNDAPGFNLTTSLLSTATSYSVVAFGYGGNGTLGNGANTNSSVPVAVFNSAGFANVAIGNYHGVAAKTDGTAWAWGNGGSGQLGHGADETTNRPVQVNLLTAIVKVGAGGNHSLAVKADGTVWAWGEGGSGQLGNGLNVSTNQPTQVSGLTDVAAVAGGSSFSLALKSDGTVWVWGANGSGLGNVGLTSASLPVAISGLAGVVDIAVSPVGNHVLALKSDGTVWVWGQNDHGQLGLGDTNPRSTPTQNTSLSGVASVAAGWAHSLVAKTDGTVWTFGANWESQLGLGTTTPYGTPTPTPVQVGGLTGVARVGAAFSASYAIKTNGTLMAWGYGGQGQVGQGLFDNAATPVQVTGLTNVISVHGGDYPTIALLGSPGVAGGVVAWEDSGANTLAFAVTSISAGPANESSQVVSFTVTNDNNALFSSQPVVSTGGTLTFTPAANAFGSATVTVIAQDDGGTANSGVDTSAAQTFTLTVNSLNDAPTVTYATNNVVVLEDSGAFTGGAAFASFSPGPASESAQTLLGYTVANNNNGLFSIQPALANNGTLTFTLASATNGSATVTVIAQDSGGTANGGVDSSTNTFTITVAGVNHAPSFALAAPTVTVLEDSGAQTVATYASSISAGPAGEASQVVTFTVTNDANALFLVQPAISTAGTLTFTPALNAYGSATVTVIAHDDGGTANGGVDTSAPQTFTVTVTPVNDTPAIAFATNSVVVLEDSAAASVGFATVTTGPANESSQTISGLSVTSDNPSLFSVAPALTGGTLTFTPSANANGSATVTVIVQDDGGTANGGVDRATNTFTISFVPVNDAPVITFASNVVVLQDSGAASLGTFATITTGPANESSQSITNLGVSNDNTSLFSAQPALSGGTLTFTPALNAIGTATVTVIAQDDGGTANGGVDKATNTFTISVIGVNHAPTFALRPVNTQSSLLSNGSFEAGSFTGWTATDTANSTPTLAVRTNGANLGFFNVVSSDGTYSATHGFSGATAGSISIAQDVTLPPGGGATLSFTYRAAWQTFGAAADRVFRFAVQPGGGGADLISQTILTATPNSFVFQTASTPVTVDLSAFAGQTVRVVFVTDIASGDAGNGSFQLDNVQLSATTPNFTVYENSGASSTLNFATNILAGPPGEAAQTVAFLVANNSNGLFSSQPAIAADGTLTFTPAPDANGTATVTVRAQDNGGTDNGGVDTSVPHTFTITLLPVNSAPRITVNTAELVVNEDRGAYSATIATLTTGPADESGQSITNVVTGNNNNALFSVQPAVSTSGLLTFTPTANANGSAIVTFTAQDNGGTANGGVNQTTRTFILTVTNVNDAPSFALPQGPAVAAGAVWTAQASGSRQWSRVVASADGTKLAAIYWGGLIHTSADSGATWTPQNNSGSRNWIGLASSADGTKLAAAVNGGGIYTSVDSGVTWTLQAAAGTRGWGNLGMSPDGSRLIASGYFIPAFGSTDGGVTWTQIQPARQWGPITISDNNLRVSMVETGGPIWTSLDFGTNWFTGTGTAGNLNPLAASADGTKLVTASAQFGTIYTSTNSGTNWTSRESVRTWIALASSADGSFLVAAVQNGLIYTSSDSGVTWTPQPGSGSRNWSSLAMSADGSKMFATDGSGFIYSSGAGFGPYVVTVLEDSGAYTGGANFATSISAGPADESTQVVDFLVSNDNNALFSVPPAVDASGTLTFTPAANAFGSATVTVRAHDDGGTDNGGVDTSAAQTFTLNVTNVNDAPSITLGTTTVTVNEDSGAYSGALATFAKGPANESGQSITNVTVTGNSNPGLFSVAPAVSTSGVLTFTPAANANGSATVTITAQDNGGTANGGVDLSAPISFTITVGPVNDAPSFAVNNGLLSVIGSVPVGGTAYSVGTGGYGQLAAGAGVTTTATPRAIVNINDFIQVSAGDYHGMGLRADGTVWVWGRNDGGQLANGFALDDGSPNARSFVPLQVAGLANVIKVDAAFSWNAVLKADGTVWTWGLNNLGQMGQGTNGSPITTPTQVPGLTDVVDIVAAGQHTVALKSDGTVWSWGWNGNGELGRGVTGASDPTPGQITTLGSDVARLFPAVGVTHFVQKTDGTIWAWGAGYHGNFGNGQQGNGQLIVVTPFKVTAFGTNQVLTMSAGQNTTFAVLTNGTVTGCGYNNDGQLGLGFGGAVQTTPVSVPGLSNIVSVSADWGGVALDASGGVLAWSQNGGAQNGLAPALVAGLSNITAISSGQNFYYALGTPPPPTLGLTVSEDTGAQSLSLLVTNLLAGPVDEAMQVLNLIVTNDNNALFSVQPAIAADGTLTYTLAGNAYGMAVVFIRAHDDGGTANGGVDTSAAQTFVIQVSNVNDAPTVAFSTNNVVALEDSGANSVSGFASVTSYGAGETGQTLVGHVATAANTALFSVQPAINTSGVLTFTPATNANGSTTVTVVSQDNGGTANGGVDKTTNTFTISITPVNDAPSFALPAGTVAGRALKAWGYNGHGQVGDGTTTDRTSPVQIGTATDWQSVAAGALHTVAVRSDGTLWAWGNNEYGQLGDGTTTQRTSPVQIGTGTDWRRVAAGYAHTLAIKADGTLWTWGFNGQGQLGDGTTTGRPSPVQIGTATDWQSVAAGTYHTVAVKSGGTLWAWGYNVYGQLGDGTTTGRTSPVQIGTATDWQSVAAGGLHTVAVKSGGTLWAWGYNGYGQLGDGATVNRSSPVQIGTATDWQSVAAGSWHTVALAGSGSAGPYTLTVAENSGAYTGGPNFATSISAGPANESSQVVGFLVSNDNNALFSSQPAIAADGTLTFTPAANAFGSATVTVRAHDDGGTANGGVDTSAAQTFTITVTAVNDAPSFTLAGTNLAAFTADGAVTRANWLTSLSAGPGGESGQVVSLTVTNSDNAQFTVQPAIAADGTLTFTPAPGASGVVTVGVIAQDNGGTANGGVDTSAVRYFTISFATAKVFVSDAPTSGGAEVVSVPVSLAGVGTESAVGFTLTYDPTLLSFNSATAPAGLSVIASAASAGNGQVGIVVSQPAGGVFAAGTNLLVTVSFTTAALSTNATVAVDFSSAVAVKEVVAADASTVANVLYASGTVNITGGTHPGGTKEGDVSQRPTGNGSVTVADAIQIGRFAAGLDTVTNFGVNSEFQRADCAPLGSLGDGRITVADWVQALRFAGGLETPSDAGGPTLVSAGLAQTSPKLPAGTRVVRVAGGSLVAGRANTVTVQLDAQGNEAGVSLSLAFDPTALTFVSASVGSGARGGSLVVNSTKAGSGRVGLVLVMPAGSAVAAGSQDIITLTFTVSGSGSTAITVLGDAPVAREVADVNANPVGASFVGGTFNILLPAGLKAAGMERAADGSRRLVVRNADGSAVTAAQAAKYEVHVTSNLGGVWTVLPNALVVENGALKIVDPGAGGAGLRLYKLVEKP